MANHNHVLVIHWFVHRVHRMMVLLIFLVFHLVERLIHVKLNNHYEVQQNIREVFVLAHQHEDVL
jgi:hypothetical protein